MEDLKDLDFLMKRAKGVENSEKEQDRLEAAAIRDSYAPQIADLRHAEALIVEHFPEAKRVEAYVDAFPWHMVRSRGQPADITELLGELRRCTSLALASIRLQLEKIEAFGPADVYKRWRPARDVSAIVSTAGHMRQTMEALKRQLEYWSRRLEEKLPPIAGGHEAVEGEAPVEHEELRIISNLSH